MIFCRNRGTHTATLYLLSNQRLGLNFFTSALCIPGRGMAWVKCKKRFSLSLYFNLDGSQRKGASFQVAFSSLTFNPLSFSHSLTFSFFSFEQSQGLNRKFPPRLRFSSIIRWWDNQVRDCRRKLTSFLLKAKLSVFLVLHALTK